MASVSLAGYQHPLALQLLYVFLDSLDLDGLDDHIMLSASIVMGTEALALALLAQPSFLFFLRSVLL